MERINRETGSRYARLDGTIVNSDPPTSRGRGSSWRNAQFYCLKNFDYDAAELILIRNLISDECAAGACDDCHFLWCKCNHHSAVQFGLSQPLKSLSEVQSERDAELEDADIEDGLDAVEHQCEPRICFYCGHEERFSDNEGGTCEKIIDEESTFCGCDCSFAAVGPR